MPVHCYDLLTWLNVTVIQDHASYSAMSMQQKRNCWYVLTVSTVFQHVCLFRFGFYWNPPFGTAMDFKWKRLTWKPSRLGRKLPRLRQRWNSSRREWFSKISRKFRPACSSPQKWPAMIWCFACFRCSGLLKNCKVLNYGTSNSTVSQAILLTFHTLDYEKQKEVLR